jgi:hypothetical protein
MISEVSFHPQTTNLTRRVSKRIDVPGLSELMGRKESEKDIVSSNLSFNSFMHPGGNEFSYRFEK